jgi:mannose-6-phosphate isomerase-like protein (cupin superfamily)
MLAVLLVVVGLTSARLVPGDRRLRPFQIQGVPVDVINLDRQLSAVSRHWNPETIARYNDYVFRVAKFQHEFVWHTHDDTDELFLVLDGVLTLQFRDRRLVLQAREMCVVPRGVEHCPRADEEVAVLLLEPARGHDGSRPDR